MVQRCLASANNLDLIPIHVHSTFDMKGNHMTKSAEIIASEIQTLSDLEKLQIVDAILSDLDKSDPEIDRAWINESKKRWALYNSGKAETVSYMRVMEKYRNS